MSQHLCLRAQRAFLPTRLRRPHVRFESSNSPSNSTSSSSTSSASASKTPQSRLDRSLSRLPRSLRRYALPLRNAPVTHVTAFLLLHEITAVVPLVGLTATFRYANWMPPYISEGKWVAEGAEKFGRYFRRKGWLGDEEGGGGRGTWWGRGEGGVRLVAEVATAWAITKALLPARLVLSVWATPWFARWTVIPVVNGVKAVFRRGASKAVPSGAAGTGALGAGAAGQGVVGPAASGPAKSAAAREAAKKPPT
ncbi:hypothetical protein BJ546DRAFT_923472 [Cryomyces antarcticus]